MDYSTSFLIRTSSNRNALSLDITNNVRDRFPKGMKSLVTMAELPVSAPLDFIQTKGSVNTDLPEVLSPLLYIVSERFIQVLRNNQFTGWNTYPVNITAKNGERLPGFHGFSVTGRCGVIDNSRCKRVVRDPTIDPTVDAGAPYWTWMGLYCKDDYWDGSDFAIPGTREHPSGFIIITGRVKTALEEANISNIDFNRLTELERTTIIAADGKILGASAGILPNSIGISKCCIRGRRNYES